MSEGWIGSTFCSTNQRTLQHLMSYTPTSIMQFGTLQQPQSHAKVSEIVVRLHSDVLLCADACEQSSIISKNQSNQIGDSEDTSDVATDTTRWDGWVLIRQTPARCTRPVLHMTRNQQGIRDFLTCRAQDSEPLAFKPSTVSSEGIGRLPTELLIFIFDCCRGVQISHNTISLVSKHWYVTMRSPTLWNEIILKLSKLWNGIHATDLIDIKRCLTFSKNAPLDVVVVTETIERTDPVSLLDLPNSIDSSEDYVPLSTFIQLCDTYRWRSLTISRTGTYLGDALDFDMPALRSLTLHDSTLEFFTSSGLFQMIAKLDHSLFHVDLPALNTNVRSLLHSRAMASLRTFKAPYSELRSLRHSQVLQELEITTQLPTDSSQWQLDSIPLPPTLRMHTCTTQELRFLNLDYVQHLTIKALQGSVSSPETTIPCPSLKTLIVEKYDFTSILYLSSPMLHSLHIGAPNVGAAAYRRIAEKDVTIILRDLPHHIKIAPRILICYLPLSTETTMFLLGRWPQLEVLSLRVAEPFNVEWLLAGFLRRKKVRGVPETAETPWKYVPELKRLRLVVDGSEDWNDWDDYAKRIIEGRKQSSLSCVSWICGSGQAAVVYREDL